MSELKFVNLVHQEFEDLELWYPVLRLREAGATVHLAGEEAGITYYGKCGLPATTDIDFNDINVDDYDGLLIPGGWAPDKLRRYAQVLEAVRAFHKKKKMIAHICHAGWVLASAGILKGVKTTSTPGIKDDLVNAGANWVDDSAVTDGHIISARRPPDLPAYLIAILNFHQH